MKKFLAVFLAMVLCLSVFSALADAVNPDDIEDNMTSADGKYEIAFVTDVGDLKDKSFNEGTWNGVKMYAHDNGMSYKYYKPANDSAATDDDRYDAMKAAAEAGAKAIVCAGFMQGTALEKAAKEYPDVKFIFIDGWAMGLDNEVGVVYKEEQCGYLAGYAVVMDGFEKLGFSGGGGGTNPACCRYGYGFIQGANDAAAKLGKNVEIKFSWAYGASFSIGVSSSGGVDAARFGVNPQTGEIFAVKTDADKKLYYSIMNADKNWEEFTAIADAPATSVGLGFGFDKSGNALVVYPNANDKGYELYSIGLEDDILPE